MAEKIIFKIVGGAMEVFNSAGGTKIGIIPPGITFEADASTRTESDGYVWYQHSAGWSKAASVDGSEMLLEEVRRKGDAASRAASSTSTATTPSAAPASGGAAASTVPATSATPTVEVTEAPKVTQNPLAKQLDGGLGELPPISVLLTTTQVRVRNSAGGKSVVRNMGAGEATEVNFESLVEKGGYIWVEHTYGWSAVQDVEGEEIFFEDGAGVYVPGPEGPIVEKMPGYQSLITRHPVDIAQTEWWQYFGNTSFAYVYGQQFNYHGYAQGFHAGVDYGNNSNPSATTVYAGVEGTFMKTVTQAGKPWNTKMYVKSGDYIFIYQHVLKPRQFEAGQAIKPDTVMANLHGSFPGGPHLHWEIRFMNENYMVNPLALMKPELAQQIIDKFNPKRPGSGTSGSAFYYFYKKGSWDKWVEPFDQPVIVRGGDPIAPKYVGA